MSDPLTQITDLEDCVKQCSVVGDNGDVYIRVCSYDHGLIRNEDNKPIYLTEFQKGALYMLVTDNKNPFKVKYICKKDKAYHESHGICETCKPRAYEQLGIEQRLG
jgi:hypothetical protein